MVRLSAGRLSLSDEAQALCLLAGANSVFLGDRLLTTPNPEADADRRLFDKLGVRLREAVAVRQCRRLTHSERRVRAGLEELERTGLRRSPRAACGRRSLFERLSRPCDAPAVEAAHGGGGVRGRLRQHRLPAAAR